ncbi:vasodilator-stimulated phosphoprotein [Cavenderia fasciculata]|uniref:Vasodilator-stimulated phosphoprotein n=1 Tax=Cavenderia fasciculata TaxID=261658 RepID=F4QFL4_CACFS|nr:vasodilator-stimulated phosphoprotein [Cavenderia fasciculata]EGG13467.1 vasodilator-stimulated phosphoprotein [Cavenderia fasciculata]|eukprot:XP_004350171.1 vasodilator-stimulated phosphoprotein [Cavenderia fasciculata]
MAMIEVHIFTGRAQVFTFSPAASNWVPSSNTPATLLMYHHQGNNTYRVIGRASEDLNNILVNFSVTKDVVYKRASENFHTFSDQRTHYGINFVSRDEAEAFGSGFENVLKSVKGGAPAPAPVAAAPPVPQPQPVVAAKPQPAAPPARPQSTVLNKPPAPPAGGPPVPPPSAPAPPKPPAPPGPPPPPPVSKPAGGQGRSALLGSIEGFSKGALKKTVTVDKSSPLVANGPAAPPASGGGGAPAGGAPAGGAPKPMGGGGGGGGNMMAEMLAKRNNMKKAAAAEPTESSAPAPAPVHVPIPKKGNPSPLICQTRTKTSCLCSQAKTTSNCQPSKKELQKMKEEIIDALKN